MARLTLRPIDLIIPADTSSQTATASHTHTPAKSRIPATCAAVAAAKLQAAYIPSGNTVAQRRT